MSIIDSLSLWGVPEWSQQEEIGIKQPLDFVIGLQHLALVVWIHDPMVGAKVESGGVSYLLVISDLNLGAIWPILDRRTQVDIIIHCIVVEFFPLNLIDTVSKASIDPIEDVEHSHTWHQQVHIHVPTCNDVNRQKTLQLHNVLMKNWSWQCRKELYD